MLRKGEIGTFKESEEKYKHSSRVFVLREEKSAQKGVFVVSANSSDWNKANCPFYQQLTKRTQWKSLLYYTLLIYKIVYLLLFVYVHDHHINIGSSCC